jgi:hypothetical protein
MSNTDSSFRHHAEALIDLLEDIVASYQDNDSRPSDALSLYRQRLQLGMSDKVQSTRRFVVIEGGANRRTGRCNLKLHPRRPNLRLTANKMRPVD